MRDPSKSAAQETELLFGHRFRIDKTKKSWAYGQALSPLGKNVDGYTGWMRRQNLSEDFVPRTHTISVLKAPVFKKPDIKSRVKRILHLGAQVNSAATPEGFLELASGGFIHANHLLPLGEYSETDFAAIAETHLGLPYIWGGVSSDGLDCSGLVQSSLRAIGIDCLRDAGPQEKSLGQSVSAADPLQRGDFIFWVGHVGIMLDADTLLHANAYHMRVEKEPLAIAVARIGEPRSIRRL